MAFFTDTFDGANDSLLSSRSGWTLGATGYSNVFFLDGAGAIKVPAGGDVKSVLHDTGSTDHYCKVVVGAGFVASAHSVLIYLAAHNSYARFVTSYDSASSTLLLKGSRDGGGSATVQNISVALAAGDELRFQHKASDNTLLVQRNGSTIYESLDTSYYSDPPHGGVGFRLTYDGPLTALADVFRSFEADSIAVTDTTPPTLSAASATATGETTITGDISTNEVGPAWAVLTASATKPSAAQVKAGQNSAGTAVPAATATLAVGANASAFGFSGLSPATGYYLHAVQDDAAGNTSAVATSALATTDAPAAVYPKLAIPKLRNNTGTVLASQTGATVHVYSLVTGNKIVTKTGQVSDASGDMEVTDITLVAGTQYRVIVVLASGAEGLQKATAV